MVKPDWEQYAETLSERERERIQREREQAWPEYYAEERGKQRRRHYILRVWRD